MRYRILRNAIKSIRIPFTLRGYGFTDLSAILPWRLSRECGGRRCHCHVCQERSITPLRISHYALRLHAAQATQRSSLYSQPF